MNAQEEQDARLERFLDGELSAEEARHVEEALRCEPTTARRLHHIRSIDDRVRRLLVHPCPPLSRTKSAALLRQRLRVTFLGTAALMLTIFAAVRMHAPPTGPSTEGSQLSDAESVAVPHDGGAVRRRPESKTRLLADAPGRRLLDPPSRTRLLAHAKGDSRSDLRRSPMEPPCPSDGSISNNQGLRVQSFPAAEARFAHRTPSEQLSEVERLALDNRATGVRAAAFRQLARLARSPERPANFYDTIQRLADHPDLHVWLRAYGLATEGI